jgi:hypothetical protein
VAVEPAPGLGRRRGEGAALGGAVERGDGRVQDVVGGLTSEAKQEVGLIRDYPMRLGHEAPDLGLAAS